MINRRRQALVATVGVDVFKERLHRLKALQQGDYGVDRQIPGSFREQTNTEYIHENISRPT